MADMPASVSAAEFIDAPRDPDQQALYAYWQRQRGDRRMPARADIDPADFRKLLPHVMLFNAEGLGGPYSIRLVGENLVRFFGGNFTGKPADFGMEPDAAAATIYLLDRVVTDRAPIFRIGRAYWWKAQDFRAYETMLLPLGADGQTVDMILCCIKFDVPLREHP
jgi:hypothetical protein